MGEHLKDLEQRLDAVNKKFEVRFKSMEDRFDQRFKTWEENMNKWMETVMRQQNRDDNQSMIEGRTTKAPVAPDLQKQQHEQARNSAPVESDRKLWTETNLQKQQSSLDISNTTANRRFSPDYGNPTSFNLNFSPKLEFPKFDEFEANGKLEVVIESELKEALESAEHKNRKIPIIAPELFDESPKKEELKEEKLDIGLDIYKVVSAIGPWIKLVWLELHNMKSEANNVREMSVLIFDPGGLSLVSEMVFVRAVHETKWMSKMEISIYNSWFGPVMSSLPGYEEGAPDTWRLVFMFLLLTDGRDVLDGSSVG